MADTGVITDDEFVVDESRRKLLLTATAASGALGVAFAAAPFIASWKPSERAQALGLPTELDLAQLESGQMTVTMWRKQPIYVAHRTAGMVAALGNHQALLKDLGSTHLGRLPKPHFEPHDPEIGAYWPGGWLCPCHGSRFDLAGRVFEGSPASVNLRVPPYAFAGTRKLVIGVDQV